MNIKLDFSKLPTKKYGTKENINWTKSVGKKIPFYFNGLKGFLKVVDHQRGNYIVIEYKGKQKKIRTARLMEGKIRDLLCCKDNVLKKIDFSSVPEKYGKKDWKNSVGCVLPFKYGDVQGRLKIIDFKSINGKTYLTVKYKDRIKDIRNINLLNCKIGKVIGYNTGKYVYSIGERVKEYKKDIKICARKYEESAGITRKNINIIVISVGYNGWAEEYTIKNSIILCSHCAKKVAIF